MCTQEARSVVVAVNFDFSVVSFILAPPQKSSVMSSNICFGKWLNSLRRRGETPAQPPHFRPSQRSISLLFRDVASSSACSCSGNLHRITSSSIRWRNKQTKPVSLPLCLKLPLNNPEPLMKQLSMTCPRGSEPTTFCLQTSSSPSARSKSQLSTVITPVGQNLPVMYWSIVASGLEEMLGHRCISL